MSHPSRTPDLAVPAGFYGGPRTRSMIESGSPIRVEIVEDEGTRARLATFDEKIDDPFPVPSWLAKRVLKGVYQFSSDASRLATCCALLYPKGLTPTRGEAAYHAEQACSVIDLEVSDATLRPTRQRAADAAEDLFRRGYRIPRETIEMHRAALARLKERTTTDV